MDGVSTGSGYGGQSHPGTDALAMMTARDQCPVSKGDGESQNMTPVCRRAPSSYEGIERPISKTASQNNIHPSFAVPTPQPQHERTQKAYRGVLEAVQGNCVEPCSFQPYRCLWDDVDDDDSASRKTICNLARSDSDESTLERCESPPPERILRPLTSPPPVRRVSRGLFPVRPLQGTWKFSDDEDDASFAESRAAAVCQPPSSPAHVNALLSPVRSPMQQRLQFPEEFPRALPLRRALLSSMEMPPCGQCECCIGQNDENCSPGRQARQPAQLLVSCQAGLGASSCMEQTIAAFTDGHTERKRRRME